MPVGGRGGDCVEIDFGGNRAFGRVEQLLQPRMQLAEISKRIVAAAEKLGAKLRS